MKTGLQTALKLAMKEKNKIKLETIRGLLSALQYEELERKVDTLPAEATMAVLQRELKRRREELEFAEQAKRQELVEKLNAEIQVIESFLPSQLSAEKLETIIQDIKTSTPNANMGIVMKSLKEHYSGQYDSKLASELCKKILG